MDMYIGKIVRWIECENCHCKHEREEDFYDLMAQVKDIKGLQSSLELFNIPEKFEGANQYDCSQCKQKSNAIRTFALRKIPPILTINLNRYDMDFAKMERKKINDRFEFPLELNIGNIVETNKESPDNQYELKAIIIHRGGAYGGHYHTYIHDELSEGNYECEKIQEYAKEPTSIKKIVNESIQKKEEAHPLRAILEKKSLNDTKEEVDFDYDKCDFPLPYNNKMLGINWYDFNDTNVSCIPLGRLQQQFGHANESGYILVYRRKGYIWKHKNPLEVPIQWKEHSNTMNASLQKQRDFYENEEKHIEIVVQDMSMIIECENMIVKYKDANQSNNGQNIRICLTDTVSVATKSVLPNSDYSLIEIESVNGSLQMKRAWESMDQSANISSLNIQHKSKWLLTSKQFTLKYSQYINAKAVPICLLIYIFEEIVEHDIYECETVETLKNRIFNISSIPISNQHIDTLLSSEVKPFMYANNTLLYDTNLRNRMQVIVNMVDEKTTTAIPKNGELSILVLNDQQGPESVEKISIPLNRHH